MAAPEGSKVEPLASAVLEVQGRTVTVTVERGDALDAFGDVLLLKYAQANYGLDLDVVTALRRRESDLPARLPAPGELLAVRGLAEAGTANILFVGTPTLDRFGYDAAREWAREGLMSLDRVAARAATVVTTVQGVNIGAVSLDERRLFHEQLAGFHDALASGRVRPEFEAIRIIENNAERAKRLADDLPGAVAATTGPRPIGDSDLSRTVKSVRSELDPAAVVTAGALAASVQRRHPEYATAQFANVVFDESEGETDTVDGWLQRVAALYSPSADEVLDGRQLVAGLVRLDEHVQQAMEEAEVRELIEGEMSRLPASPDLREQVEWSPDEPTRHDQLGRRLVAQALARQLAAFDRHHPGRSFMFLIDGRWGAGKSTLVQFLSDEAKQQYEFRVTQFDAWRQSRSGPPWLLLMTALRNTLRRAGDISFRVSLQDRTRWIGRANIIASVMTVAVVLTVLVAWIAGWADPEGSTAAIVASLAFLAVLWPAARAIGHALTLDSERSARRFVETRRDPMEDIARHFDWLRSQSNQPHLLIVDDLDRCDEGYVVELLDNIQKLVRPSSVTETVEAPTLIVGIAADARWLRQAYQSTHASFADAIDEPGRPLGSLFLDKLFQLRVPVPELSPTRQQSLLAGLLGAPDQSDPETADTVASTRQRLESSAKSDDVLETLRSVSAEVRMQVADIALERLTAGGTSGISETEHALERFAPLLEPNPRSVLRFTMAFSILRAARTAEGNPVSTDELALWTIVAVRWPLLAEFLGRRPDAVDLFLAPADVIAERVPIELRPLFENPTSEFRQVFNHAVGGPLTSDVIRQCVGIA